MMGVVNILWCGRGHQLVVGVVMVPDDTWKMLEPMQRNLQNPVLAIETLQNMNSGLWTGL